MRERKVSVFILSVCLSLSQFGFAASSSSDGGSIRAVDRLEDRYIDRNSSYYEDLASWSPAFGAAFDSEPNAFVFPFNFEYGISDRVTIVWVPVPLEFRYNYFRSEDWDAWGTFSFIGPLAARARDPDLTPHFEMGVRYRGFKNLRLEAMSRLQVEVKREDGRVWNQNIISSIGAGYQFGRWVYVQPRIYLLIEDGLTDYYYPGNVPRLSDAGAASNDLRFSMPLALELVVQPWRRLDIRFQFQYLGIGIDEPNFNSFPIYISLNLYW